MTQILTHAVNRPAFVRNGHNLLPVFRFSANFFLQILRRFQYLIRRGIERFHSSSFGYKVLSFLLLLSSEPLRMFDLIMLVVLPSDTHGAERKPSIQACFAERMAERSGRALVGVGGQYEGDEVKRVGGREPGPALRCQ